MGLYLHVPFCLRKCPYCSFFSVAGNEALQTEYVRAVEGQLQRVIEHDWSEDKKVATIFIGGGTPTILKPELLSGLLAQFHHRFSMVTGEVETSVEVNPATVNFSDLVHLRKEGYNRISIGAQSFSDIELQEIGRPHSVSDAIKTITDTRKAGFLNLNIDLMYGLPGQTVASWTKTLHMAMDQRPDHLAIYELTIEEGTTFEFQQRQGKLRLPSEDEVMDMMSVTEDIVSSAGFTRYEISNYALPGRECQHNINYWRNGWYVGLGPGAVSCLAGRRFKTIEDIGEYCRKIASGEEWWIDIEELDREARFRETVVMGLRMTEGVSMAGLNKRFGLDVLDYYRTVLSGLEQQNLIEIQGDRLQLTPTGMNLANQVMAQLV